MTAGGYMTLAQLEEEAERKLTVESIDSNNKHYQQCIDGLGFEPKAIVWFFGIWFSQSASPEHPDAVYESV